MTARTDEYVARVNALRNAAGDLLFDVIDTASQPKPLKEVTLDLDKFNPLLQAWAAFEEPLGD